MEYRRSLGAAATGQHRPVENGSASVMTNPLPLRENRQQRRTAGRERRQLARLEVRRQRSLGAIIFSLRHGRGGQTPGKWRSSAASSFLDVG